MRNDWEVLMIYKVEIDVEGTYRDDIEADTPEQAIKIAKEKASNDMNCCRATFSGSKFWDITDEDGNEVEYEWEEKYFE
jgi:hypothetical protein|tara:strand:- start:5 stop:241 length:237 start_codon:yes stop_codon:yes gene_type:complete